MLKFDTPMHLSVAVMDSAQLQAIYAVLASTSAAALAIASVSGSGNLAAPVGAAALPVTEKPSATVETQASESPASVGSGATATNDASLSDDAIDAHGHPWSAEMHASTKNQTNDGLWRMKVGVKRPDPMPGFPKPDGTGTKDDGAPAASTEAAATSPASPAATDVEEDEFAAFTNANAAIEGAGAVEVPARTWTDADLSSLCAQAAQKLGNADPVRAIIATYTAGTGETPHSRHVPADTREAFAAEIEKAAGITYAG